MENEYKCICGKIFYNSQSFNGHKSHCKTHQLTKYGSLDKYYTHINNCLNARNAGYLKYKEELKEQKKMSLVNWKKSEPRCLCCNKIMTEYYGSGQFCSKKCAASRQPSQKTKERISNSVRNTNKNKTRYAERILEYNKNPCYCIICNKPILYEFRHRKTCSSACLHACRQENARNTHKFNVKKDGMRSKNEILFCELCEQYFGKENVLHNIPMFNGWDADVIIPKFKLAIL